MDMRPVGKDGILDCRPTKSIVTLQKKCRDFLVYDQRERTHQHTDCNPRHQGKRASLTNRLMNEASLEHNK